MAGGPGKGSRSMRAALHYPDFRRLALSSAVSQVGDWLYNVALAVYVFDRTHSAAWVGAMTLLRLIPYVLFAPLGGMIADRFERRFVLVISDVVRAGLMTVLAFAVALDAPVLSIGLLALATTAAGTAYLPSTLALIPDVVGEDDLASANSLASFIQCVSIVIGPAIGGLLLAVAAPVWSFVANAVTFGLGALLTLRIRTRSRPEPRVAAGDDAPAPTFWSELAAGARVVAHQPVVRVLTSLAVGASFIYGVQTVVLVILAGERVGSSAGDVGFLYGALGLGGLVGAPVASRLAHHPRLGGIALGALGLTSLTIVALIPVEVAAVAFVLVFFAGIGEVVVDVISVTLLQRNLERDVVGRVFGVFDALTVGAMIAGSLIVAPLRNAFGYSGMLVVVAGLAPLLVLLQWRPLVEADRDSAFEYAHLERTVTDLRRVSLFGNMQIAALERLARGAEKERFAVGETILAKGDPANRCYTVLHGRVRVHEPDGDTLATLEEDDFFGEIGLLHETTRTASVTAASDCVLYSIDAGTFRAALDADTAASAVAFEAAGRRLSALGSRSGDGT
jgi:MFS family permease